MKLRLGAATLLLALATAACASENPVAPRTPPQAPSKDVGGGWMGSGH
jgi:hypothetical protein